MFKTFCKQTSWERWRDVWRGAGTHRELQRDPVLCEPAKSIGPGTARREQVVGVATHGLLQRVQAGEAEVGGARTRSAGAREVQGAGHDRPQRHREARPASLSSEPNPQGTLGQ